MEELTFEEVSRVNAQRCKRWHPGFPGEDGWTGADWSNAMQGEAGEAGNIVKKLRRLETGLKQAEQGDMSSYQMEDLLLGKLSKEIGDTFLYLDLLAAKYNLDLAACVVYAFNQVSEREGFPERLAMIEPTEPRDGLYDKFEVRRKDGKDRPGNEKENAEYFVLDYAHDPAAQVALDAYAEAVSLTRPGLSEDLKGALDAVRTQAVAQYEDTRNKPS